MKNSILIVLLGLSINLFGGGPWPQPKGAGYIKLSEWWTVFDQHYTDSGLIDPNLTTGVFNTNLYAEYGFTNRFTGIVNANLFSRNFMNNLKSNTTGNTIVPGEALNSVGDIDVVFKYGLNQPSSKIPVAVSLTLGLPTGTLGGGAQGNLQTGDGEFNQMIQIDAGTGFKLGKFPAYFSTYVGLNNRTENFSEEFRYGLELGINIIPERLWLTSRLTAVESFKNGLQSGAINSTSIFANNTEFTSIGLEANLEIANGFGLSAGFAGAIRGEIIAAAPSYSVGVYKKF